MAELPASSQTVSVLSALPAAVLIGDSLTEFATQPGGWAVRLQNHYVSRRDVLVRGSAGYNSVSERTGPPPRVPAHRGKLMV